MRMIAAIPASAPMTIPAMAPAPIPLLDVLDPASAPAAELEGEAEAVAVDADADGADDDAPEPDSFRHDKSLPSCTQNNCEFAPTAGDLLIRAWR